jgi:hypothetical protein
VREAALLKQNGDRWLGELPKIKGITWGGEFRRGFVARAMADGFAALAANAGACWAATPLEVVYVRWPRQREVIGGPAPIPGLRELSISASLVARRDVARLADAPLLSTLRALNLHGCGLGVEGFRRLVGSPHLGNLKALRVPENFIGNGGVDALYEAVSLTSLDELDLSELGNYGRYGADPTVDSHGLEMLASWPGMTRLRSLKLSGNDIGRDGLRALLGSPRCGGLKELALRANPVDGSVMEEFGAARSELRLDILDLGQNLLRNLGPAHLASAACLRDLKVLVLDRCEMGSDGARQLARAPFLDSLRLLKVDHNSFGPEGLHALLEAQSQTLHTLLIANNDLGDEGAVQLAASPGSDALLEVNMENNGLGDPAAQTLAKSRYLRNLLVLRLSGNLIGWRPSIDLEKSPLGKRLALLENIPF